MYTPHTPDTNYYRSVENEMLTQKLSIKRHIVVKKYEAEIEALYASGAFTAFTPGFV